MRKIKEIAKQIPGVPFVYRVLRDWYVSHRLKSKSMEDVFTDIYKKNGFRGEDSISGPGSDLQQTGIIVTELLALFDAFDISTMLDIPCGDFHWMKKVDLNKTDYTGGDIVEELIQGNTARYGRDGIRFKHLNLINDKLPKVDLVFCRDCLVHFSFADIALALDNVCNSDSKYFLTTTFVGKNTNLDINTGSWRPINLEIFPFGFPKPLKLIKEGCTENEGAYVDKSLGLWRIADIRACLPSRRLIKQP
jgi:SAM-dependent methyltransferase